MAKTKALASFGRLNDAGFIGRSQAIAASMTGNSNYPKPAPAIALVAAALKKFADALAACVNRDKVKIALRKVSRTELENLLIDLAAYVNYTAAGDPVMLATSGFPLSKTRSGKLLLGVIENFSVQPGKNAGEMILSVNGVVNVKNYSALYGPVPIVNDTWKHLPADAVTVVSNLQSGIQYSFKICAYGAHGQAVYSEIISKWVS